MSNQTKQSNKKDGKNKSSMPKILKQVLKEESEKAKLKEQEILELKQQQEENQRLEKEKLKKEEELEEKLKQEELEKKKLKRKQSEVNQKKNKQVRENQNNALRLGIDIEAIRQKAQLQKINRKNSNSSIISNQTEQIKMIEPKSKIVSNWEDMADNPELWTIGDDLKTIWHTNDGFAPTKEEFILYRQNKEKRDQENQAILEEKYKRMKLEDNAKKEDNNKPILKAPVICVLGNVDAGKTSLLDKIKKTNIQDEEAGGITQSISSIWINAKNSKTGLPGALIIDTPGHDSFEHLRELGAKVCNFVILMVDINESLKQQTIRAINIIKKNRIPFVVALNKVDRIYEWKSPSKPTLFKTILESQKQDTQRYFYERIDDLNYQMNQHGFNSCLYFLNEDPKKQVSFIPVSARTGDGITDLLNYVLTLSHKFMLSELTYSPEKPEGVVLGYEILKGFGSSIDLILTNGQIEPKHKILIETINGVEEHEINMVLTGGNQKGKYNSEKSLKATQNCKIIIKNINLNTLILGRPIHWLNPSWTQTQTKELFQQTSNDLDKIIEDFTPTYSKYGVSVHSSSFGGLRAITNFLEENNIPYFRARVGKIKKTDIISTESMNQKIKNNKNFYDILVGFDVDFDFDINTFDTEKISTVILSDNIIYSLYDKITNHIESQKKIYYDSINEKVPYPVEISVIDKDHVFANKNPILIGVKILTGILKIGTPLMVFDMNLDKVIGFVSGIKNRKQQNVSEANENEEVSVKIEPLDGFTIKQIDRDFPWDSRIITYYTSEQYQMGLDYLYTNYPKKVQRLFNEYTF